MHDTYYCNRPTRHGGFPCQARVHQSGAPCYWHRGTPPTAAAPAWFLVRASDGKVTGSSPRYAAGVVDQIDRQLRAARWHPATAKRAALQLARQAVEAFTAAGLAVAR